MASGTAEGGLAGRYANALFELAQEQRAVDTVSGDLATLRRAGEPLTPTALYQSAMLSSGAMTARARITTGWLVFRSSRPDIWCVSSCAGFFTSISAYVVGTPQTLGAKSVALGVFDAGDATYTAVTAGDTLEGVVIYKDTGVSGTSPLIAYIDTITGFPLATNGGDITIQWDNGAYKIFSL